MLGKFRRAAGGLASLELVSPDRTLEQRLRDALAQDKRFALEAARANIDEVEERGLAHKQPALILIDIDPGKPNNLAALERVMRRQASGTPVIVLADRLDATAARTLLRLQVADWLPRTANENDVLQACEQVLSADSVPALNEASVYAFLPAAGGVGNTALAIQSAFLLGRKRRLQSTCLVDLDFQAGAAADYLDLSPSLQLDEIAPHPDRLDEQLLEVMLSKHASGLSLLAAESSLRHVDTINGELVAKLLDMAAARFDCVVVDLPRVWLPWTENVLRGSNKVFVVTEMTVPGLRHAQRLLRIIEEQLPPGISAKVIVNRYRRSLFGGGINSLRRKDVEKLLGDKLAGFVTEDYRLAREAIDRGVPMHAVRPRNRIDADLARMLVEE